MNKRARGVFNWTGTGICYRCGCPQERDDEWRLFGHGNTTDRGSVDACDGRQYQLSSFLDAFRFRRVPFLSVMRELVDEDEYEMFVSMDSEDDDFVKQTRKWFDRDDRRTGLKCGLHFIAVMLAKYPTLRFHNE